MELPHRHNELAHFFTGHLTPHARPGSITQKVDAAMDSGAEGFALWSPWICWADAGDRKEYWAMRDKYGLEEYLDELSRAVEVHEGSPVGDAKIALKGCGVDVSLEGDGSTALGRDGAYQMELKPDSSGRMLLSVHCQARRVFAERIGAQ